MKSGGGVLCISMLQAVVGLCLLGIYEGYKQQYLSPVKKMSADEPSYPSRRELIETPLDWLFYLSIFNNVFSLFGAFGVWNSLRELVMAFFAYNAVQIVVSFHYFCDLITDARVTTYTSGKLGGYEYAATAFMMFNFVLSLAATVCAVKAIEEIKLKQRDEYNRLSVISDNLQFEPDNGRL